MDEILQPRGGVEQPSLRGINLPAVSPLLRLKRAASAVADGLVVAGRKVGRLFHGADGLTVGRRLTGPLSFLLVSGIVGVGLVVSTVYTPSYVVTVDGTAVGAVSDPSVFEAAVERVERRASDILGYDYDLGHEVSYDFALSERSGVRSSDSFDDFLFDQIGEIMESYVLTVNGKFIGASQDRAELTAMLEAIQAPYLTENTTSAAFVEDVSITSRYTPVDVEQDLGDMREVLTANTSGETTYEVQKGDTFMQIALDNGMTMEELEALNPDVDVNVIYIGQILNVKEIIPYLSVTTTDTEVYTEAIPSPIEEVPDDSMYQGDTRVIDAGSEGVSQVTASVTYVNGHERERNVTESVTVTEPTTKVIAVGTVPRPKTLPTGHFIWPVYGTITSNFGYRYIFGSYSYHSGLDIALAYGSPIAAADGGTVIWAGTGSGSTWSYGNYVIIDHGNGMQTYYAHCSSLAVSVGEKVYQGQTIAYVGSTGRSTGPHCHFQVKINGTTVNPLPYLP